MTITEELETFFNDPFIQKKIKGVEKFDLMKKLFTQIKSSSSKEETEKYLKALFDSGTFGDSLQTIKEINKLCDKRNDIKRGRITWI